MSRSKGTFNFAANFEVLSKAPLDARQVVETYADLTTAAIWEDSSSLVWLYDGAIVSVANDPDPLKNGLYFLNDADNYTLTSSWDKLASSSGSTLNDVQNIGSGFGVFSGVSGTSILLRSLVGSGNTNVSLSGDSLVIHSVDSTALQDGILKFDSNQQTFQPYSGYTSGTTFYTGLTCPDNTDYLNLNARLTVTALRLSTGCTALTGLTFNPGDLYWDSEDNTISLQQTADVKQQIGQELYVKARNDTGGLIPNGSVVYVSGSDSGRPTIALARAGENDETTIQEIVGMATEDIPNGQSGFVTTSGLVREISTTGFTAGDVAYLSADDLGGITNVKPDFPDFAVEIGIITNVDPVNGEIYIKIVDVSERQTLRAVEDANINSYTATTRSDFIVAYSNRYIYLPSTPKTGQQITVADGNGDASLYDITIYGNGNDISGTDYQLTETQAKINTNWGSITFVFNGVFWSIVSSVG